MAALQGREYIEFDPEEADKYMNKAIAYINSLRLQKEKEEFIRMMLIIAVLVIFIVLATSYAIKKR